jgi:hypothetical protein
MSWHTIWKFPLTPTDVQDIVTHVARPLSVGWQDGQLVMWAVVRRDTAKNFTIRCAAVSVGAATPCRITRSGRGNPGNRI